ncbi:MAG: ATP-dependent helicase [Rhodothermia bacterium]|nr:ATP-dependent helicase [Rhodothermia bacterium]
MARRIVLKSEADVGRRSLAIDYRGELNEQQYAAATASGGPILVIAGAGTGKTRTLIYRVAYLVETGVRPERIVLLTFTRRASREMLTRASVLLDGRCSRVKGGTFHSYCLGVLRRYAPKIGFPNNFTILDASDSADVIDAVRTAAGLRKTDRRFPKKRRLQSIFSAVVNQGTDIEDLLVERYPQFLDYVDQLVELYRGYAAYKERYGLMDYDDLLSKSLVLFDEDDRTAKAISSECKHLLVDEYQDTNRLQAELVRRLSAVHRNVMAVGDDAQSIYRFRGAEPANIFEFPRVFADTTILKLEQNYRSTQPILDLANHVLDHATEKYEKELFSEKQLGDLPAVVPAPDDQDESRFVTQTILQLREDGVPLNRIAVLFRSGFNSYALEMELNRRNVPFVKYGGLKLSEAAHIKDIIAHLRILENPRDAISWNRVLQLLEGVGPKTARDLIEWITTDSGDPYELKDRPYSPRYIEELKRLFNMFRQARGAASTTDEVELVVAYYDPVLKRKYFDDFPKRQQDLEHFAGLSSQYQTRESFLSSLALDPIELTALEGEATPDDESPLILSTIHSAKGLEFHTVFVIQALEGVLPSSYSLNDGEAIDEELRLLYVAITRAEQNLFISYPTVQYRRFEGEYFARPSRFIAEVPESILEPCVLVEDTGRQLGSGAEDARKPEMDHLLGA